MANPIRRGRIRGSGSRNQRLRQQKARVLSNFPSNPNKRTLFVASIRLNPSRIIDTRSSGRITGSRRSRFTGQRRAARFNP